MSLILILFIVGLVLIISEMFIPVFGFFALIGLALIFAGTSLAYDPTLTEYGMAMILAISLALSLIVGGGLIVAIKAYRKRTQTGKEGIIGDSAVIIDWNGTQGRVLIDDENWHAQAEKAYDFAKDDVVRVVELKDLTLIIEPKA